MSQNVKMEQRITAILRDLIAIPTAYPPGTSTEISSYIAGILKAAGYKVDIHSNKKGLDNVVARMGSGSPCLVFNTHIDTVGAGDLALWEHPPFEAHIKEGKVFGLGSANCKSSGAVQLWLAEEIARRGGPAKGEVVFTFVTDEESLDENGMAFLRESGVVKPDLLLLGAPTDNALIVSERGVLWTEIETFGRPAHAGAPEDGDNAISRMIRVCSTLEKEMAPRLAERVKDGMRSTMSLGLFQGGVNTNVVPSRCLVQIDRRLLPSETVDQAFKELQNIVTQVGEPEAMVSIRKIRGTNGFIGDVEGTLVKALGQAIQDQTGKPASYTSAIGVSDGRYFSDDGIEIVNFGPGIGAEGHASNESVEIAKYTESALIQKRMIADILGLANDD